MNRKKYFAIINGSKKGIFYDEWDNVKPYVSGYPNAVYKGFMSRTAADEYVSSFNKSVKDTASDADVIDKIAKLGSKDVIAFVHGGYKNDIEKNKSERYSYGVILFTKQNNKVLENHLFNSFSDEEGLSIESVSGGLKGVMDAISWAIKYNFSLIDIYYDYDGIEKWANGTWKAKNSLTQSYINYIDANKEKITISFSKVSTETEIKYDEKAKKLAENTLKEKKYKTNKDGSIYIQGLDNAKWNTISNKLVSELGPQLAVQRKEYLQYPQIIFLLNKDKVTITLYDDAAYIQGSSSKLFDKIFSVATLELDSSQDVLENLNHYHNLDISAEELDEEYSKQMPNASVKEKDPKVILTLKNAVYNTLLTGYKPDYTDLIYPVARIMEHYLHSMLTKGGVETEKVGKNKVVRNNFGYFDDKNKDGEYSVNSNKVKENLSINQCNLLNQIYNWYHNNRHEMFHWNKESGDTTVIPNMVEARDKIYEGEQLIERYYDIF